MQEYRFVIDRRPWPGPLGRACLGGGVARLPDSAETRLRDAQIGRGEPACYNRL